MVQLLNHVRLVFDATSPRSPSYEDRAIFGELIWFSIEFFAYTRYELQGTKEGI